MSHTAYARAPCQHVPLASAAHRRAPSGMTAAPEYIPKHTHGHGPVHTDHARHARAQGESARIAQAAKRTETRPHATQGTLHRRRAGAQTGGEPCGDGGGRVNRTNRQRVVQLDTHDMRDTYISHARRAGNVPHRSRDVRVLFTFSASPIATPPASRMLLTARRGRARECRMHAGNEATHASRFRMPAPRVDGRHTHTRSATQRRATRRRTHFPHRMHGISNVSEPGARTR